MKANRCIKNEVNENQIKFEVNKDILQKKWCVDFLFVQPNITFLCSFGKEEAKQFFDTRTCIENMFNWWTGVWYVFFSEMYCTMTMCFDDVCLLNMKFQHIFLHIFFGFFSLYFS